MIIRLGRRLQAAMADAISTKAVFDVLQGFGQGPHGVLFIAKVKIKEHARNAKTQPYG